MECCERHPPRSMAQLLPRYKTSGMPLNLAPVGDGDKVMLLLLHRVVVKIRHNTVRRLAWLQWVT